MDAELQKTFQEFPDAFEQVFDKDWNYTKEQSGIYDVANLNTCYRFLKITNCNKPQRFQF